MLTKAKGKNGKLVDINDVPSGLECECTCPGCGGKLVAKKGEDTAHHFAHYRIQDCGLTDADAVALLTPVPETKKMKLM